MSDTCEGKENLSNSYTTRSTDDVCPGDSSEVVNSTSTFFDETLSAAIEAIAEATRLSIRCDAQLPDANPIDSDVSDQMDTLQCTFANDEVVDQNQEQSTDEYLSPSHIDTSDIFSSVGMTYCVDQSQENCTLTQINTTSLIRTCHLPVQSLPNSQSLVRMQPNWRQTLRPVFEKGLIERLWAQGQLGTSSPQSLLLSMWFIISRHFGVGCRTEHAKLVHGNFCIGLDQVGNSKQVHFFRDPKARLSSITLNRGLLPSCECQPNQVVDMQPNYPDRCPVRLFEAFLGHRPKSATSPNSPFYLQPERTGHSCSASMDGEIGSKPVWYSPYALGKNRIGSMLNTALQSIGIPIGHQTNLSRFCDTLVTAAIAPASGEDGVRLTELAEQLAECKQPQDCPEQTVDALTACASRLIDLAATPGSAIYQQLTRACVKTPVRVKPRRRRVTTTASPTRFTSNLGASFRRNSSTLKTVHTENLYSSVQTCPQSAMDPQGHNGSAGVNQLRNHLDPESIPYYTSMKSSPPVNGSDFVNVENDEFHLKNEMMCTFENQNEVVTHQLLAQMFQDTSVNLPPTELPTPSRLSSSTISPSTLEIGLRSSGVSYTSPSTMILLPINSDGSALNVAGQMNSTSQHSESGTLVVDENTVTPTRLGCVDQFLSNPSTVKVATSSTKLLSTVGTKTVYVSTNALTTRQENQPTNAILPRVVARQAPSMYSTSTTTCNTTSVSSLTTNAVSSTSESGVHVNLPKSRGGGGSGRSVKLELRELLDLVLASARTPKPAAGDHHKSGSNGSGGGAGASSLTVAATSGLLRPPVGLVTQLLWRTRALDDRGPWILTFSMWWLMQHYFGVGSRMHHVRLRWGHLRLVSGLRDPITDLPCDAVEYVGPAEFTTVKACAVLEPDESSKSGNAGDDAGDAAVTVHMVRRVYPSSGWAEAEINVAAALSSESVHQRPNIRPLNTRQLDGLPIRPGPDFVALYKTFVLRRQQPSLSADAPFYVQPLNLQNPQNSYNNLEAAWFSVGALGKNRIGALMRNIVDKVVRPNLSRVADAAISAARNACIAAASRAALALPLLSESASQPSPDDLNNREWLLNKLSCLLGLCTKSAYAPDGHTKASQQTWRTVTSEQPHRPSPESRLRESATLSSAPVCLDGLQRQPQVILLAGGSGIGLTGTAEEDIKPMLLPDGSLAAANGQQDSTANNVIILPCASGLAVANSAGSGSQLNSVTPAIPGQVQQTQRRYLHPTTALASSHFSVLNKDTTQQHYHHQQCHQKQVPGDTQLPIILESSLFNNGGTSQLAYLDQTNTTTVGPAPVKVLFLPSNAKPSADVVSFLPPGLSGCQSSSSLTVCPSTHGMALRQIPGSAASTVVTNTVLSSPFVIPAAGIKPLSAGNFQILTSAVTVSTTTAAITSAKISNTGSLGNPTPSNYSTPTAYNGLSLPEVKVEQPSPNDIGPSMSSSVNAAPESYVRTTAYRQIDLAGTPTIAPSRVTPTGYQSQFPLAQLATHAVANDTNPTLMMITPQTSLDYPLHQLSSDGGIQTNANIFTAVYNPITGVYTLTPATNLVALHQPPPPTHQTQPILVPTTCDRLLLSTRGGVASAEHLSQVPTRPAPVIIIDPVRATILPDREGGTDKQPAGHNPAVFNGDKEEASATQEMTVFQGDVSAGLGYTVLPPGLPNSGASQLEQQQCQSSDPGPFQLLSLQSVINSASAFQCNDFPAYVEQLFRSGVLGASRPWCLNFTVWFINTLVFEVENRTDHVNLRWGDFSLCRTADRQTEYLFFFNRVNQKAYYLAASPQSSHSLGFNAKFAESVGADVDSQVRCPCPVAVFKTLRDHRPPGCLHPYSKFYLQPRNLDKTADTENTTASGECSESVNVTSPAKASSSHKGGDKDSMEWFTEHAWGKNKLGGLFAEAARLARLPMIWLRKHRSRNFFPGGGGSGLGALCVQDEQLSSSGEKRQATDRNRSCDQQQQQRSNPTGAVVKRQRRSAAQKKNSSSSSSNNNRRKQEQPTDSMVMSERACLVRTKFPPTSSAYSSSAGAAGLIQLPSSSTILQPKDATFSQDTR